MLDFDQVQQRLQAIVDDRSAKWSARHADPPTTLYHYTTPAGLIGIAKSGKLWASDLQYMNDASEMAYASDGIRALISNRIAEAPEDRIVQFFQQVDGLFNPFGGLWQVYAACLCEKGNLLSQWRGYGATGGGYAVGFYTPELNQAIRQGSLSELFLRRVIYDPGEQAGWIDASLDAITACIFPDALSEGDGEWIRLRGEAVKAACFLLKDYLYSFKTECFSEEQEWRLVHIRNYKNRDHLAFRPGTNMIVPYVRIPLALQDHGPHHRYPISDVVLGPTVDAKLAELSVKELMASCGQLQLTVNPSGIPLRA